MCIRKWDPVYNYRPMKTKMSGVPHRLALQNPGLLPMAILAHRGNDLNPILGLGLTTHHSRLLDFEHK